MAVIIPSLASADPFDLRNAVRSLAEWPVLHLDIEDGNFVPNLTFGLKTVRSVAAQCRMALDVHLMVTDPLQYIDSLAACGVQAVAVHWEALAYPSQVLNRIRDKGMRAGAALNPRTPPEVLAAYADALDYALVMTAEPDNRDQSFLPQQLDTLRRLRRLLPERVRLMADGGIGTRELPRVTESGAELIVMGRCVFQAADPGALLRQLSRDAANLWQPRAEKEDNT